MAKWSVSYVMQKSGKTYNHNIIIAQLFSYIKC